MVGEAYKILSDTESRTAYDIKINLSQSKNTNATFDSTQNAKNSAEHYVKDKPTKECRKSNYGLGFVIMSLGILLILVIFGHRANTQRNEQQELELDKYLEQARADYAKEDLKSRTIEDFSVNLNVSLNQPYSGGVGHIIKVPKVTLIVGKHDKERVVEYIKNNKSRLNETLKLSIVSFSTDEYSQLKKIDGEDYLRRVIQKSLNSEIGVLDNNWLDPYFHDSRGIANVLLPMSFSTYDTTN